MKKGHFDSKKGGNVLLPKTESESWGLPLMNGGLKNQLVFSRIIDCRLQIGALKLRITMLITEPDWTRIETELKYLLNVLNWSAIARAFFN